MASGCSRRRSAERWAVVDIVAASLDRNMTLYFPSVRSSTKTGIRFASTAERLIPAWPWPRAVSVLAWLDAHSSAGDETARRCLPRVE
jgi:hypothetical protein